MIIKTTTVWARKNIATDFWQAPTVLKEINEPLIKSGELTMSWSISDDGLQLTQISTFSSQAVFDTITTDPARIAFNEDRKKYNQENNIELVSNDKTEFNVNA